MGRRIYCNGDFVWKYTFGRQPSEMCRYTDDFGIGKYVVEKSEDTEGDKDENGKYYTYEWAYWEVEKSDLRKLKELVKSITKGKTLKKLNEIGMKALKEYIAGQSKEWKENFKNDLKNMDKWKSINDVGYGASYSNNHKFEPYEVYANAIEKEIIGTLDFLYMTKRFISYITSKKEQDNFIFTDEF